MRKSFERMTAVDFITLEDCIKMQLHALEQIKEKCIDGEHDPLIDELLDLCFVSAHGVTKILNC